MAISTNGTIYARLAGGLYNTVLSNATYLELVAQDPSTVANKLYAADFGKMTDLQVGTTIVANLGLSALTGLDAWVAAQLTAAGAANKGAKIVSMLNDFSAMTADTTYGTYATAYNTKVDAALAASQTTGKAEAKFSAAAPTVTSFTLTTGVDAVVGSAGDDTITAPATVATTGAAQTTINSGDSIDGGAGTDSLTLTITGANNNSLTGLTIKGVEKISYVGSDNLASGAAAVTTATAAKAVTAAALTAAVAAKVAANTALTAAQKAFGLAEVISGLSDTALATAATTGTGATVTVAAATGYATYNLTYTAAEHKAAAAAALLSLTGTAITGADSTARADVLETNAKNALIAATVVAAASGTGSAGAAETAAYLADANAASALAGAKAALTANASIAANAEATSITIDGVATDITSLIDAQTVTIAAGSKTTPAANSLKYSAAATNAKLALTSGFGTFTFTDSSSSAKATLLAAATVTGTVASDTAASTTAGAIPGTITLVDRVAGTTTGDTIKTLNLGLTSNATVTITDLTAVTAIDGSTSTGGLTLAPLATTLNVTTGAGADDVNFIAATDLTSATKLTSSLSTGAGNDKIIVNVSGGGTSSVNAGAGDDTITMTSAVGSAVVDGGDGKDTVVVGTTTFSTGAYNSLKANVLNVEVLSLTGAAATLDASKAAQFTEYSLAGAASVISKVADTQTVDVTATSATATAAGYVGKGTLVDGTGVTSTTYAGSLNATAKGTVALTANASDLKLAVSTVGVVTNGVTVSTASAVTLTGDVKSAAITVNGSANNSKLTGSDIAASVSISPSNTGLTAAVTDVTAGGASTTLANLASVTLSGTGSATIVNTGTGSKLATIDASGLNGKLLFATGTTAGTTLGSASAGLSWTAGTLAETVKLGSALDTLTFGTTTSTYAKMDSITGYSVNANAAGDRVAATSDNIKFATALTFVAKTTGVSGSLDAALTAAGAHTVATVASENVVFQNGGNTYIYIDNASNGLDDADVVIELVGLVDLTLLIADLASLT